jgi:hypothetical protein
MYKKLILIIITTINFNFVFNIDNKSPTFQYEYQTVYCQNIFSANTTSQIYPQLSIFDSITFQCPYIIQKINFKKIFDLIFFKLFIFAYNSLLLYCYNNCKIIRINDITIKIKNNPQLDICSICHNNYNDYDDIRKLKKCFHVYHDKCIRQWIINYDNKTCPICRKKLIK